MHESGSYQLVRRIGSGPGGPVYLARSAAGEVAIRQFQSNEVAGSDVWRSDRERFLVAAHQQTTLTDPSIVPTLEVLDGPEEASVVMEYLAAGTLQTTMLERSFSPEETNRLLRRAALALDFAHSRGVVHGDLKPSNIFLLPNQEIMVGDFAISPRARRDPLQFLPLNLTHGYLSPEHFNFPMLLEGRSDQYSLAVIAYEMYTGQLPFGTAPDYLTAVLAEEMTPSRVNPNLPTSVDGPLMRALSRNPAHRFNSCMEFVSELSANLITAPDIPKGKRRILPLLVGLAALLALVVGFLIFRPGNKQTAVDSRKEEPKPVLAEPAPPQPKKKPTRPATAESSRPKKKEEPPVTAILREPKPRPFADRLAAALTPPNPAPKRDLPKETRPPTQIVREVPPAPVVNVTVELLSRNKRIPKGGSFKIDDPDLGELGHGDLKALVRVDAPPVPRTRLTIEWTVNGIVTDRQKPVSPDTPVEYNNEPTLGNYKVTIRLDGRPLEEYSFRITP